MTVDVPPWAAEIAHALPYPLVFATVSRAHLRGFAAAHTAYRILGSWEVGETRPVV